MLVEHALKLLMVKEPFYGLLLTGLQKEYSAKCPTLGVGFHGLRLILTINLDFWNTLTDGMQLAVLKHEAMHVAFKHLVMDEAFSNKQLANIAMDTEINQYISELSSSKGCCNFNTFKSLFDESNANKEILSEIAKLKKKAGSVYYYKLLCKLKTPQSNSGLPNLNMDDHSKFGEAASQTEAAKEVLSTIIDSMLKTTAETVEKANGVIPSELRERIDKLFKQKDAIFNWKQYFRRLLGTSIETNSKKSKRHESKRFSGNEGLKIIENYKILVAVDTSASVSKIELAEFFSEINHIKRAGAEITIIEVDAAIAKTPYKYNGLLPEISGRGGTDFAPAIEYYNEHRSTFSTMVYFTDGYASLSNFTLKKPMMWVITSDGNDNRKDFPGIYIKIPKN